MFEVRLSSSTQKFLKKCEKVVYDRIYEKLNKLSRDPFQSDCKRVVGRKEKVFRVRVGKYRILYVVFTELNKILISDIDKREKVYD